MASTYMDLGTFWNDPSLFPVEFATKPSRYLSHIFPNYVSKTLFQSLPPEIILEIILHNVPRTSTFANILQPNKRELLSYSFIDWNWNAVAQKELYLAVDVNESNIDLLIEAIESRNDLTELIIRIRVENSDVRLWTFYEIETMRPKLSFIFQTCINVTELDLGLVRDCIVVNWSSVWELKNLQSLYMSPSRSSHHTLSGPKGEGSNLENLVFKSKRLPFAFEYSTRLWLRTKLPQLKNLYISCNIGRRNDPVPFITSIQTISNHLTCFAVPLLYWNLLWDSPQPIRALSQLKVLIILPETAGSSHVTFSDLELFKISLEALSLYSLELEHLHIPYRPGINEVIKSFHYLRLITFIDYFHEGLAQSVKKEEVLKGFSQGYAVRWEWSRDDPEIFLELVKQQKEKGFDHYLRKDIVTVKRDLRMNNVLPQVIQLVREFEIRAEAEEERLKINQVREAKFKAKRTQARIKYEAIRSARRKELKEEKIRLRRKWKKHVLEKNKVLFIPPHTFILFYLEDVFIALIAAFISAHF